MPETWAELVEVSEDCSQGICETIRSRSVSKILLQGIQSVPPLQLY